MESVVRHDTRYGTDHTWIFLCTSSAMKMRENKKHACMFLRASIFMSGAPENEQS